ncbi:response regulator [Bacillus sp. MRMR6]|uniref:response regulator n=1 Tax=Bacillus sp. MRMR6 TaxID=1928617 RepID=UPI0009531625|nr:response regulator [Bacillus sp. MRMR6]OLS40938.1 AraC family transcriptional regulator [Bacillus sp. MRMR6]
MYKVIVVEDDRIIRRGIRQAIPWEEHGFVIAGEAGDGEVALELIEKEQPQVVVSDINMPFMNGLEMARLVKEKSAETRIIFLTGYEDFKYAHEALKLKAFDYLLKPVDSEQLLQKVKEAAVDWENEARIEKRIIESMPLLQRRFFQKLLKDEEQRIDVEKELSDFGIIMEGPAFAVILVKSSVEVIKDVCAFKEIITTAASPLLTDLNFVVMNVGDYESAILLSLENEHDSSKGQLAQSLFDHLKKQQTEHPVTITLGRTYSNLFEIGQSFIEARLAMDMRHIMGTGRFFFFDETVSTGEQEEDYIKDLEAKLDNQIKLGLPEKVKETLDKLHKAILERKTVPLSELKIVTLKYSTMLLFEIEKWTKVEIKSFNTSEIYKDIMGIESLEEMMEILQGLIQQWSVAMQKKIEKNNFSHVDEAIKYIKENYHDSSLTLQKVADLIHVSTPYLSNLFKLEKGFNFGDYLLELRMMKAMEILREENVKTYEVAEKVGYSNSQYFSICFKKYTGYTPAEYRKKY